MREWCHNAVGDENGQRCLLGGAYGDPSYMFRDTHCTPPWNRDRRNGFRCVQYLEVKDKVASAAFDFLLIKGRCLSDFKPHSMESVQNYIDTLYQYDKASLNALA